MNFKLLTVKNCSPIQNWDLKMIITAVIIIDSTVCEVNQELDQALVQDEN